jgi:hypothetical protein
MVCASQLDIYRQNDGLFQQAILPGRTSLILAVVTATI